MLGFSKIMMAKRPSANDGKSSEKAGAPSWTQIEGWMCEGPNCVQVCYWRKPVRASGSKPPKGSKAMKATKATRGIKGKKGKEVKKKK